MSKRFPHAANRKIVTVTESLRAATPAVVTRQRSPTTAQGPGEHAPDNFAEVKSAEFGTSLEWQPIHVMQESPQRSMPFLAPPVGPLRPPMVIKSGFERLDFSIAQLIDRLPSCPLQEKFDKIAEWIDKYNVDLAPNRVARCLTAVLDAAEKTESRPRLHPVLTHVEALKSTWGQAARCVAGSFVVHQLLLLLCRINPQLTQLCERSIGHLWSAVYCSDPAGLPTQLLDSTKDPDIVRGFIDPFKGRMHFQVARDTSKRLLALERFVMEHEDAAARQKRVVNRAAISWQAPMLRLVFRAWRKEVDNTRAALQDTKELDRLADTARKREEEIAQLQTQLAELQTRLNRSITDAQTAKDQLAETVKKRIADAEQNERRVRGRDALIDDLEGTLAKERAAHEEHLRQADERYREIGNSVARALTRQASAIGRRALKYCAWPQGAKASGGAAQDVRIGGKNTVLRWINQQLEILDPEERYLRPTQLVVSPQLLDVFAFVTASLLRHAADAPQLERALGAVALTGKISNIVAWCIDSGFPVAPGFGPDVFTRNSHESAVVVTDLFTELMVMSLLPREAIPPGSTEVEIGEDSSASIIPAVGEPAWGPDDVRTNIDALFDEYAISVSTAMHLRRASVNRACTALGATISRGSSSAEPLTKDEEIDKAAFAVSKNNLGECCTGKADAERVQQLVEKHYRRIRAVFLRYSAWDGSCPAASVAMADTDFIRLLCHCRALVPDLEFVPHALDPRRFISALVTVAHMHYPNENGAAGSFNALLERNILPFGEVNDTSWAPALVRDDAALMGLVTENRRDLHKIFRAHGRSRHDQMSREELEALLQEAGILARLPASPDAVQEVMDKIVYACRETVSDTYFGIDRFIDVLSWLGVLLFPDPFLSVPSKFRRLVFDELLPAFRDRLRLAFVPMIPNC